MDNHLKLNKGLIFKILQSNEITEKVIEKTVEIDEVVYEEGLQGVEDICKSWLRRNPDIYTIAVDRYTGKPIGYINAMPLEEDVMEKINSGKYMDSFITAKSIKTFNKRGFYDLYLCSVAVHPEYQGTLVFKLMFNAYLTKLTELARRGVFIRNIVADVVSCEGTRIVKLLGMKEVNKTNHGSIIYSSRFLPLNLKSIVKYNKELVDLYNNEYEEIGLL